jgi:effector-binding domain-containing protein
VSGEVRNHEVVLLKRLPQHVLAIRSRVRRGEVGRAVEDCVAEIQAYLVRTHREPVGPPCARLRIAGPGEVDLDAALPVARGLSGEGRIHVRQLPTGSVAVTQHYGPLARLREAYDAVEDWIAREGAQSRGAPWEVYWSGPEESDPLAWRTELLWPVILPSPVPV